MGRTVDEAATTRIEVLSRRPDLGGWEPPAPWHQRTGFWVAIGLLLVVVLTPIAAIASYQYEYADRIYRGVTAMGVDLGGMTPQEAERALSARAAELTGRQVVVRAAEAEWRTDWNRLGLSVPVAPIVERAMAVGREGSPLQGAAEQVDALTTGVGLSSEQRLDERRLGELVQVAAGEVDRPVRDARIELKPDLTVDFTSAQTGRTLDVEESLRRLRQGALGGAEAIELAVTAIQPVTTDEMRMPAKERAERILAGPIVMTWNDRRWTIERGELADLLRFRGGPGVPLIAEISEQALVPRLQSIATEVGQEAQDAMLDWNGGNPKVTRPSREGRQLDPISTAQLIVQRAAERERTIPLPVKVVSPAVDAAKLPEMGIKELVDSATTSFTGSVPEKAHNIRLAASRLNGVVVAPRALFSFNKALGPTTIENGYQTAFGITTSGEQHKTVPSVAGGICQVATTLFQPVFWTGYQLEERHWHLYWIPAYTSRGAVGLDATVDEDAGLDLQFFNNSDTYLLIQARADASNVTFELYGTKPSWQVKVDGPTLSDRKPPDPTPVTEQEASLPAGQQIQVESAREGFTAAFVRTVAEGGNARTLKLESRYVPSRNVTLVGTGGRSDGAPGAPAGLNRPVPGGRT
ncbi:MAG: VanW family protein [Chloroflexi bacterium]|nr:VanW family protein [Chloroflexota bacterium]